jgi:hypothetical protein
MHHALLSAGSRPSSFVIHHPIELFPDAIDLDVRHIHTAAVTTCLRYLAAGILKDQIDANITGIVPIPPTALLYAIVKP